MSTRCRLGNWIQVCFAKEPSVLLLSFSGAWCSWLLITVHTVAQWKRATWYIWHCQISKQYLWTLAATAKKYEADHRSWAEVSLPVALLYCPYCSKAYKITDRDSSVKVCLQRNICHLLHTCQTCIQDEVVSSCCSSLLSTNYTSNKVL